jgi:hypothetical protein
METKTYKIGDKTYSQKKLVLGQICQLLCLMKESGLLQGKEILIPANISTKDLVDFLSDKGEMLSKWISIILKEDRIPLSEKNLEAMTSEIDFSIEMEQAMEVISDFFDFLNLISLSEKLATMMVEIENKIMDQIGLKKPASSSREEILPSETPSSGDSQSKNASLT